MKYEWDDAKNMANKAKHGLAFEDMERFDWTFAICPDSQIVDFEERELWIGPIGYDIVAVIVVEREDDLIRIISLRMSTLREFNQWKKEMQHG